LEKMVPRMSCDQATAAAAELVQWQLSLTEVLGPHERPVRAMRRMATATGAASFEVLVATTAPVMSAALDGCVFDVTGRTDLAAVGALAHEQTGLVERPVGRVDVA
jgi:hypothetical protein